MITELPENHFYFSSESVTEGHPDKLCDSISDSILDACLEQDQNSKVACECVAKSNMIMLVGEITTKAKLNLEHIVRERLREIGYDDDRKGINYKDCDVIIKITQQSPEINSAVCGDKKEEEIGAGDQGLMFGYATNETQEKMPFSHLMATKLSNKLAEVRKNNTLSWLRPDGKTQVTVEYKNENGEVKPVHIHTVLISCQHNQDVSKEEIVNKIKEYVINPTLPKEYYDEKTRIIINPSGKFITGGPEGDAGLTGRKIIVDTYGGWGAHGGGAFSGKDCTKVDRSGAYMARYIAKSLVHNNLCKRCLVQISYSIGISRPMSIYVNSYGTVQQGKTDEQLSQIIEKNFDLRPGMIIKNLKLTRPIFKKTSVGGHFGREDPDFIWEIPLKINF